MDGIERKGGSEASDRYPSRLECRGPRNKPMDLSIVILAAGKGTRMRSGIAKVLQPIAGRPLLQHVLETGIQLQANRLVVVYGHAGEQVQAAMRGFQSQATLLWVKQEPQSGTGHAVLCALPVLPPIGKTLILYGDVPFITTQTLQLLLEKSGCGLSMLTMTLQNPSGYGRIYRDHGRVLGIVEEKDADAHQKLITEVNTGILCVDNALLHAEIPCLNNDNAQKEYYLTDLIARVVARGIVVDTVAPQALWEVEGVNDKVQLAALERDWQKAQAKRLMLQGLTIADPLRFDLRGQLTHGSDCYVDINVIFEGQVTLGNHVHIEANCVLKDCVIGDHSRVRAMSSIDSARIEDHCLLGPFARIRPDTHLESGVHVGNFVEVKKSILGRGSKANHLTYLGDAIVGEAVNIGAGTITCNYDGFNKHTTQIDAGVFIGSNNSLVAPVHIHAGATTGAGSVISKDVPENTLAVGRSRQQHIEQWQRPQDRQNKLSDH